MQNIGGTSFGDGFVLALSWQPAAGLEGVNASYMVNYTLTDSEFDLSMSALQATRMNTTASPALNLTELLPNSTYDIVVVATYSEGDVLVVSGPATMPVDTGGLSPDLFPRVNELQPTANNSGNNSIVTVSWRRPNVTGLAAMLLSGYNVSYTQGSSRVGQAGGSQQSQSKSSFVLVDRNANSATLEGLAYYFNYTYEVRPLYSFGDTLLYAIPGASGSFSTGEGGEWGWRGGKGGQVGGVGGGI